MRMSKVNRLGRNQVSNGVQSDGGSRSVGVQAGRALGAVFLFFFGGAWLGLWATLEFDRLFTPLMLVAACTLALISLAYRKYHVYRPALMAEPTPPERRRMARNFNIVNALQWILVLVVANVLNNIGLAGWIVPAVMLVVGVHFLPLASIFSNRNHYVTGGAMIATALLYPFLAPKGPQDPAGPLIAGIILWASASVWLRSAGPSSDNARDS